MLNPFSFLLARTLAQREGVDDSRANWLALMMGMTGLHPAMGAVVAQQSARREVSSAQTATESAELKDAVNSLRTEVAGMQETAAALEWLERNLVEIPQQFDNADKGTIESNLLERGFADTTVETEESTTFLAGQVIRIEVGERKVDGELLAGLKFLPWWVPFKVVVSSGDPTGKVT